MNLQSSINNLYKEYISGVTTKHEYINKSYLNLKKLFEFKNFLKNSDVMGIDISKKNVIFKIKSPFKKNSYIKLLVDENDSRSIPYEIFNFKKFEENERNYLIRFASKSRHIIDIGANIGWYSINFNLMKNVKSVHSFEPIPSTFNILKKHLQINDANKITINNSALSNKIDTDVFYLSNESGSASMRNIQKKKNIKKIQCKTITLDKYVTKNKLKCDLIKVDVEGSEFYVFLGAKKTLIKYKPIIFTEMLRKWAHQFNYSPNDIIKFFKEIGYLCFIANKKKLKEIKKISDSTSETNFFFLHKVKHKKFLIK